MEITAEQLIAWSKAMTESIEKLRSVLPDKLANWTGPLFDGLVRILNVVDTYANQIEDGFKLVQMIAAFINARRMFGADDPNATSVAPAANELPELAQCVRQDCERLGQQLGMAA